MPRARRKPSHPPDIIAAIARGIPAKRAPADLVMPVAFVETWLRDLDGNIIGPGPQEAGTVIREIREEGKAIRKRRDREHQLERMARERDGQHRISSRQRDAGLVLYQLWCRTELSPPAIREVAIDCAMNADAITVAQVEAMMQFQKLAAVVPSQQRRIVDHVVLGDRAIRDGLARNEREAAPMLAELQIALDLLANHLGY